MQEIDSKLSFIMTETARSLLTEAQVLAVMHSWKDAKEPAELKAMLNTFVERVELTADDIDIKLKLEIASHAYEGDDLTTKVSRNEVKRMFLLGEDSDD